MPIIFQLGGNFWIETFHISRVLLAAGATSNTTLTLTRPGRIVGVSASMDCTAAQLENISIVVVDNAAAIPLAYGQSIIAARMIKRNNDASDRTFGANVVLFMRKN